MDDKTPMGNNQPAPCWEIWQSEKDGKWYFHLKGRNGEIQVQSTQGHNDQGDAERAIGETRNNSIQAVVLLRPEKESIDRGADAANGDD